VQILHSCRVALAPRTALVALLSALAGACGGGGGGDPAAPAVELRMADATVAEGSGGGTSARALAVTLTAASDSAVTVDWATVNGTAVAPGDYTAASGTLSIPAGETAGTINLRVAGDVLDEADEVLQVALSNAANADLPDDSATITIRDDDGTVTPSLSIGDASVTEGNAGSQVVTLTVTL